MRIGLYILALALSACGARVGENHTGGKTSWLSTCVSNSDCSDLQSGICANELCTTACDSSCDLADTTCAAIVSTNGGNTEAAGRACLPDCMGNKDCVSFGSDYSCERGVCIHRGVGSASTVQSAPTTATDAGTKPPSDDAESLVLVPDPPLASDAGGSESAFTDAGTRPPPSNPNDCAPFVEQPTERPYLPALEALGLTAAEYEPACEGVCGYRYTDGEWAWDWSLVCPLLDATSCQGLKVALTLLPANCATLDDCTAYSGELGVCEVKFAEYGYFDSKLTSEVDRDARTSLAQEAAGGGCVDLVTEPYRSYPDCIDGQCTLPLTGNPMCP